MTTFFGVHLVLTVVSLTFGTVIGVYGIRALLTPRRRPRDVESAQLDAATVQGRTSLLRG